MPANGFNMRQHWMLPIVLAPNVLSQAPPAKLAVAAIEHFESFQAGPFQPLMHIDLGDSRQNIKCIFDTGSSDIIVPKAGSAVCKLANQQCRKAPVVMGDFEPAESKDVTQVDGSTFNASFSGGDGFDGPYIKTTINIGGAKVDESQVALAVNGSLPGDFPQFPICGVGPVEAEQTDKKYVNLVAKMKENGVIGSNVMGVVLNRNAFENGSVVFGGIDKSKFKGELQEVPIDPVQGGKIADFVVNMTSIRLQMNDRPPKQGQQGQQGQQGKGGKKGKQSQQGQQVRRSHHGRALPRPSGGSHGHHVLSKREGNNEDNGDNGGRGDRGGNGGKGDNQRDRGNRNNGDGGNNKKGNGKNNQNGGNNKKNNKNGNQDNGNQDNGNQNNGNQNNGNQNNGNQNNGNQNNGIIDLGLKPSETFTLIDTGGVGLQLPRDSLEAMAKALGTRFRDGRLDSVDCAVVSDNNKLLFGFNNDKTVVSVPLSHTRISNTVLNAEERASGECFLQIDAVAQGENLNSMGFPWGSAVYTVFDLDKNRLLFAEAVENSTQPDLQPFP
ncbi:putative aspartic-type endopeptidase (OpsB) [Metarhizium anisopliae]